MDKLQALLQTTWVRKFINSLPDIAETLFWVVLSVIAILCLMFFVIFFCFLVFIGGALM